MKLGLIASLFALTAVLAPSALADQSAAEKALNVDTPSMSESDAAQADWYRQFTQKDAPDARPIWQAEPTSDFSMLFDNSRRWALNLEILSRPQASPLPREEMQAGATFRITPRLSIGGEVSVGSNELDDASLWQDKDVEAGIRLKSAFKF
jgi:hypothetical protein